MDALKQIAQLDLNNLSNFKKGMLVVNYILSISLMYIVMQFLFPIPLGVYLAITGVFTYSKLKEFKKYRREFLEKEKEKERSEKEQNEKV